MALILGRFRNLTFLNGFQGLFRLFTILLCILELFDWLFWRDYLISKLSFIIAMGKVSIPVVKGLKVIWHHKLNRLSTKAYAGRYSKLNKVVWISNFVGLDQSYVKLNQYQDSPSYRIRTQKAQQMPYPSDTVQMELNLFVIMTARMLL